MSDPATRRILHLSDIHFGRARPELVEPLIRTINTLAPDLVVLSGDLTQRARNREFRAARTFIDRLDPPVLTVPGNHDTPLDNLALRLADPWRRWRRWIGPDLEPAHADDAMVVVGINTVNRWAVQSGYMGDGALRRIRAGLADAGGRMRIVVLHHPLEHAPGTRKRLTHGARRAVAALDACGADIVLTGHLHTWRATVYGQGGAVQVQAGTGLSNRLRGEENDFNLLTLSPGRIHIERHACGAGEIAFSPDRTATFTRGADGWTTG
jgi:3',5'-cyclic AMP phosphodiesterase CpdA